MLDSQPATPGKLDVPAVRNVLHAVLVVAELLRSRNDRPGSTLAVTGGTVYLRSLSRPSSLLAWGPLLQALLILPASPATKSMDLCRTSSVS